MDELSTQWRLDSLDDARQHIEKSTDKIKKAMTQAVTGAIELGYVLRHVEETGSYKEGGYSTVNEFAESEYGYSASQVSRFKTLNEQYSVGGNSPELDDRWSQYNQTNLIEMLKLPENVREDIDPNMKRDDLRQLTKDIEQADEKAKEESFIQAMTGEEKKDPLESHIEDLLKHPKIKERFKDIFGQIVNPGTERDINMAFTETGFQAIVVESATFFLKGNVIKVMIGGETTDYSWSQLVDVIRGRLIVDRIDGYKPDEMYMELTGEILEEKKPADNVEKAEKPKKETPKQKTETKKAEKPEDTHCEAEIEEEKTETENPMPEPEVDVVDPGEVEAETAPHEHEMKARSQKVIGKVFGETKALHIYRTGVTSSSEGPKDFAEPIQIAVFDIDYCPFCGVKL